MLTVQGDLEAACVNSMDKDKCCATALQPGGKSPLPHMSALAYSH